ncbi:Transcription factor ILR3 [Acorus calamus]|uniref:Transcription factor ILR3 n=1 Tax=Acorus calamus TaxID=4465 RepID=A0AAV9F660_ACOCL|nr:Transcription factor ILR3 [Acorus calamus]
MNSNAICLNDDTEWTFESLDLLATSIDSGRFQELGSILNPGRPPKTDKSMILSDAARALVQLRNEAEQLKDTIEKLQETIKDLKTEKIDLRDEKMKLKADKERLEEQLRVLSAAPAGYMPYPVAYHAVNMAAFTAQTQAAAANKTGHYYAFPSVPFNQLMPFLNTDCSQDAKGVSPNA